ncbi:MAG: DUF429 domain-containing protein [Bacteroidetes bacterium]|nr:MAG: DUF429 domain-containing protein [Bacteroidota bacterium]
MSEASATPRNSNKFIGLDGCSGGWVASLYDAHTNDIQLSFFEKLKAGKDLYSAAETVWIDMPIGLSGDGITRTIDYTMRIHLRWRKSSVFFPPSYEALSKSVYEEANRINKLIYGKGLSKQAWNLRKKILELFDFLQTNPILLEKFKESHPELVFQSEWPREYPLSSKNLHLGYVQRIQVIGKYIPDIQEKVEKFCREYPTTILKKHDVLDAVILSVKAACGSTNELTQQPDHDKFGLPFLVVY